MVCLSAFLSEYRLKVLSSAQVSIDLYGTYVCVCAPAVVVKLFKYRPIFCLESNFE